jgi:hypothetical protein
MSEKIYSALLRLYPSRFREAYGDEALQLFQDRARDESGLLPKVRLWFDMLADIAFSLPIAYGDLQPALAGASSGRRLAGVPSFAVLENNSLPIGPMILAGILSLSALSAFATFINHAGGYEKARVSVSQALASVMVQPSQFRSPATLLAANAGKEFVVSAKPQAPVEQPKPQTAADAVSQATNGDGILDAAERQRVIAAAIADLKQYYSDRGIAQKTADALISYEKNGDDESATSGGAFADLLTHQMRNVSHDMNLLVIYSRNELREHPAGQTPEALARYRKAMEQENCMFRKVEILPHNIGYLKVDFFPDTSVCESTARTAMASLNSADAVIIDLRDNTGGFGDMVSLIASYLFDHPEYLYSPRDVPTVESWTRSPVEGSRLADKPIYLLTSSTTISAAEYFSYNLKALKRAVLVGQRTHGSSHSAVFHRIDDHFGIGIPEAGAVNPYGKTDWEGTGVEPDVRVKAEDALDTAVRLAEDRLQKK